MSQEEIETFAETTKRRRRRNSENDIQQSSSSEDAYSEDAYKDVFRHVIHENKNIYYLNGEALSRPLKMPAKVRNTLKIFLVLAAIIGAIMLFFYFDNVYGEPAREQAQIQQSLSEPQPILLPNMKQLLSLDDSEIMENLRSMGSSLYELKGLGSPDGFEVVKLPNGVSLTDAAALYARGISNLTPAEAVKLLNGSWDLEVDNTAGANMSLHYADFTSSTIEGAIQIAMTSEQLDTLESSDSGKDNSGNTYVMGNITIGGKDYTWRVSAVPLSDIYSIRGIPENSYYVGIRMTS